MDIITGLECTVKSRNWAEDDKMLIPKDYSTAPSDPSLRFPVMASFCRVLVSVQGEASWSRAAQVQGLRSQGFLSGTGRLFLCCFCEWFNILILVDAPTLGYL